MPQLQSSCTSSASRAERQIDRLLDSSPQPKVADGGAREHRDVEILRSLPGVGRMVTATMLTEASGPLADRDYATLRAYTGAAPVTKRSGKRAFFVQMRYACKRRLRQALYHWSRTSIQHDAAARAYYDALRARGHHHARALRSVADRWLRILVAMLTTRTLYDPSRLRVLSPRPLDKWWEVFGRKTTPPARSLTMAASARVSRAPANNHSRNKLKWASLSKQRRRGSENLRRGFQN